MRFGKLVLHLESSLHVDFKNNLLTFGDMPQHGAFRRAVAMIRIRGPFQKPILVDKRVEFLVALEEVLDSLLLAFAWRARRCGNRNPAIGDFAQQTGHQGALAST